MDIIVYLFHGGLVGIGKSQCKKFRKHGAKDYILFPPIEVDINIGGGPDQYFFLILGVIPWRSMNCHLQGLTAPETSMNDIKLA